MIAKTLLSGAVAFCLFSFSISSQGAAGARDETFTTPIGSDAAPLSVRVAPDGRIYVGGNFQNYASGSRKTVARLMADGALDTSFDTGVGGTLSSTVGQVTDIEIQTDGKILIAGSFDKFGGVARTDFARLNADGSLDQSFAPAMVGSVKDIAIQSDGKILVCGPTSINGVAKPWKVYRLNEDGSLDGSFDGPTLGSSPSPIQIKALANGKILVAATYLTEAAFVFQLIRLNSNGALDGSFTLGKGGEGSPTGAITRVEVAPDGKIVIAGIFTKYNDAAAPRLARLNEDGSVDGGFNMSGATINSIGDIAVQSDGKVLFCGALAGSTYTLSRFENNGALDTAYKPELGKDGFTATSRVTFQGNKPIVVASVILFAPTVQFIPGVFRLTVDEAAPPTIATPPTRQVVTVSGTAQFKVAAGGTGPFTYQWKKGANAIAGATSDTFTIDAVTVADAGNYSVVISNASGATPSVEVELVINPATAGEVFWDSLPLPNANADVKTIVRAPDAKIIVGGFFNSFAGVERNRAVRLLPNGQVDSGFKTPNTGLTIAYTAGVQSDGKVILGGNVAAEYNGVSHFGLLRYLTTGVLDTTFNPNGIGADDTPFAIGIQPDDKIITGGFAGKFNDTALGHLFRVTAAGAVDTAFNPSGSGASPALGGYLHDLAIRSDGKIFGVGLFLTYNGADRKGAVLLNSDGTLDNSFTPILPQYSAVNACAALPDGTFLVGGAFLVGPPVGVGIVRLNANGLYDPTFAPLAIGPTAQVFDIAVQKDGKILIGGTFDSLGGAPVKNLARLKSNGELDPSFDTGTGPNGAVMAVCVTPEDTLFIGGEFTEVDGLPRSRFARLNIGPYEEAGERLTFTAASNALTFDWSAASFSLQYTDTLNPPNWTTLPDAPPFTANTSSGIRFYRLIAKP